MRSGGRRRAQTSGGRQVGAGNWAHSPRVNHDAACEAVPPRSQRSTGREGESDSSALAIRLI